MNDIHISNLGPQIAARASRASGAAQGENLPVEVVEVGWSAPQSGVMTGLEATPGGPTGRPEVVIFGQAFEAGNQAAGGSHIVSVSAWANSSAARIHPKPAATGAPGGLVHKPLENPEFVGAEMEEAGNKALAAGNLDEAERCYTRCLDSRWKTQNPSAMATVLANLGQVSLLAGRDDDAKMLYAMAAYHLDREARTQAAQLQRHGHSPSFHIPAGMDGGPGQTDWRAMADFNDGQAYAIAGMQAKQEARDPRAQAIKSGMQEVYRRQDQREGKPERGSPEHQQLVQELLAEVQQGGAAPERSRLFNELTSSRDSSISSIAAYDQLKKTTGLPLTGARSSDRSQYPGYQGKIMEAELRALFQDRSPLACLADPASYTFTPKNSQTVLEGAAGQG